MKIRIGFVSNSSSSSFVLRKKYLTPEQIEKIKNHSAEGKKMGMECWDSPWDITEEEDIIRGYVSMNNFDMYDFLCRIGVLEDRDIITWGD